MPLDQLTHNDPDNPLEVSSIRISKHGGTVQGLAEPRVDQDAATKRYVDNMIHPFLLMGA
jgi:hypothetical protein